MQALSKPVSIKTRKKNLNLKTVIKQVFKIESNFNKIKVPASQKARIKIVMILQVLHLRIPTIVTQNLLTLIIIVILLRKRMLIMEMREIEMDRVQIWREFRIY